MAQLFSPRGLKTGSPIPQRGNRQPATQSPEQSIAADILIIGAGGSGLRAAIEAKERGLNVTVVSKRRRIWRRSSSRRDENLGESWRLAVDAGARIRDAVLVQFHPSGLVEPESAAGTLVSEAARGEVDAVLAANGTETVRPLQRAIRAALTT